METDKIDDGTSVTLVFDAVIDVLKKKKVITDKEIKKQLNKNQKEYVKFMEENPKLFKKIEHDIITEEKDKIATGNYIGWTIKKLKKSMEKRLQS